MTRAFWLLLLRCGAEELADREQDAAHLAEKDEEEYFLNNLASYAITALNTREFALCYMRDSGVHGCKVVPLNRENKIVANLQRLDFSAPETQWGNSQNLPPLQTRGVADDLFVLCAVPECMVAQRIENEFKFSPALAVKGKLMSLTMTQSFYDNHPGRVSVCARTNDTMKNSLFDVNVACTEYEITTSPLAIALPATDPSAPAQAPASDTTTPHRGGDASADQSPIRDAGAVAPSQDAAAANGDPVALNADAVSGDGTSAEQVVSDA
eukprot:GEMP01055361.1.p1 GENE.GEMP01055361.1~~GEMP01055361.1.p1  ORF type:complete len:268 (+),score=63.21 GEMP01055361.1:41-844(+)